MSSARAVSLGRVAKPQEALGDKKKDINTLFRGFGFVVLLFCFGSLATKSVRQTREDKCKAEE